MTTPAFILGDRVRLKSGSPDGLVVNVERQWITVGYRPRAETIELCVHVDQLVLVERATWPAIR